MTTILRVEHHKSGNGILRSRDKNRKYYSNRPRLRSLIYRHGDFPNPFNDRLLGDVNILEFCAFKSIDQFQEWVTKGEIKILISFGFKIYLIDVSEARIGEYQVLYKKENILQSKDITNMFS